MRNNLRTLWCLSIALILSLGAVGCGSDDNSGGGDAMSSSSGGDMTSSSSGGDMTSSGDMTSDGDTTVEMGTTCVQILECVGGIEQSDQAAFNACVAAGTDEAQAAFNAFGACIQTNCAMAMTEAELNTCINASCATEATNCQGPVEPPDCSDISEAAEVSQACGQMTPCPDGAICILENQGDTDGICRQQCVPGECEQFCGANDACGALQGGGGGACLPLPTCDELTQAAETGQACGQTAGACPDGAVCIITMAGATEGTCQQACIPGECEDFCAMEEMCQPIMGAGSGACL